MKKRRTNLLVLQMVGPRHGVYGAKAWSVQPMIECCILETCQVCRGLPLCVVLCETFLREKDSIYISMTGSRRRCFWWLSICHHNRNWRKNILASLFSIHYRSTNDSPHSSVLRSAEILFLIGQTHVQTWTLYFLGQCTNHFATMLPTHCE